MREIRTSGSEGGEPGWPGFPTPTRRPRGRRDVHPPGVREADGTSTLVRPGGCRFSGVQVPAGLTPRARSRR